MRDGRIDGAVLQSRRLAVIMFCQNCGQENVASAKYCVKCGSQILVPNRDVEPVPIITAANATNVAANTGDGASPKTDLSCEGTDRNIQYNNENSITRKTEVKGLKLDFGMLLLCGGFVLGLIGAILPFFYTSGVKTGSVVISGAPVSLIVRGFWWLIIVWGVAVAASLRGWPVAGLVSGGFTLLFALYFLVSYLSVGTTIGAGLILLIASAILMLVGSVHLLLKRKSAENLDAGIGRALISEMPDVVNDLKRRANDLAASGDCRFETDDKGADEGRCSCDEPSQSGFRYCARCGSREKSSARFCGKCGAPLQQN